MAKAVAVTQGWEYERHEQFNSVLNNAVLLTGDEQLDGMRGIANDLHRNFYTRKRFLDAVSIGRGLDRVAELLEILEPLTNTAE
jgi:hypothetical protein